MSLLRCLAVASALALPRAADACAVCLSGRDDDTQRAFLLGTILLSTLPFALVGGIALWLHRRSRQVAAAREAARREPQLGEPAGG